MGVPLVIIHFRLGLYLTKTIQLLWYPMAMEPTILSFLIILIRYSELSPSKITHSSSYKPTMAMESPKSTFHTAQGIQGLPTGSAAETVDLRAFRSGPGTKNSELETHLRAIFSDFLTGNFRFRQFSGNQTGRFSDFFYRPCYPKKCACFYLFFVNQPC